MIDELPPELSLLLRTAAQYSAQHVGELLRIVRHCAGRFEAQQEIEHALLLGNADRESIQPKS